MTAISAGAEFEDPWHIIWTVHDILKAHGWREGGIYGSGGVNKAARGFRKADGLCLLNLGWEPANYENTPPDRVLYTIDLTCAQGPAEPQGDYHPLIPDACGELTEAMSQTLGVDVVTTEAHFEDRVSGVAGTGCQMAAVLEGLAYQDTWSVYLTLLEMLNTRGWREDKSYQATGPYSEHTGFRKANALCLLDETREWSENPESTLVTIVLSCAEAP